MSSVKANINFNTRHLTKGDPLPPYNGKLRLYNMRFCPYAQRALMSLKAKNIDFEVINIDLVDKPEWFITKSAFSKVPALEVADGVSIYESLVIPEYLDEVYPDRPLLSKDPLKKAFDKIIVAASSPIEGLLVKLIKTPEAINEEVITNFFKALDFLQSELHKRGTKFLGGDQPGYADYMIWPLYERVEVFDDKRIKPDAQKYKLLLEYFSNMRQDPVVKEYAVADEIRNKFYEDYGVGRKPKYDMLLEE